MESRRREPAVVKGESVMADDDDKPCILHMNKWDRTQLWHAQRKFPTMTEALVWVDDLDERKAG